MEATQKSAKYTIVHSKIAESTNQPEVKVDSEPEPEPVLQTKGLDDDLKKSLEEVDPWMANKLKNSEQ